MQVLELLAFLPLSTTFLSLPALSCPFLLFTILSGPLGEREDRGTHGRTNKDIQTDGRTDGTQFYQMFTGEERGGHTHGQTDILF